MRLHFWLMTVFVCLAQFGPGVMAKAAGVGATQSDDAVALAGEWLYVEGRTEGRAEEERQPSMSVKFELRVEDGAVVMVRGEGGGVGARCGCRWTAAGPGGLRDSSGLTRSIQGYWRVAENPSPH